MDRQIIFRGKDAGGAWHHGYLFQGRTEDDEKYSVILKQMRYVSDDRLSEDLPFAFYKEEVSVVDPNTIGQFTGLHDKNGIEIYEGDILQSCYYENVLHEVVYSDSIGAFMLDEIPTNGNMEIMGHEDINRYFEIIGNIYDNPELIKKEN